MFEGRLTDKQKLTYDDTDIHYLMMIQIYTIDQRASKSIYCYYTSFKRKQRCRYDRNGHDQSNVVMSTFHISVTTCFDSVFEVNEH